MLNRRVVVAEISPLTGNYGRANYVRLKNESLCVTHDVDMPFFHFQIHVTPANLKTAVSQKHNHLSIPLTISLYSTAFTLDLLLSFSIVNFVVERRLKSQQLPQIQ